MTSPIQPDLIERAADAWDAHCLAVERTNAAIPDLEATSAERAVYDERYRASEQAKRDMYGAAFELAKWASANRGAITTLQAQLERVKEALTKIKRLKSKPIGDTGFSTGPQALLDQAKRIAKDCLADIGEV